ncbi:hypothetical protein Daesc_005092 [Daldinia eschscholtzii]|uniref:Uncharacterized protein n=1 Tax=Daldinia eschscholtzii TaxID=292717 RepID=A0AAX6MJG5_9PEZI
MNLNGSSRDDEAFEVEIAGLNAEYSLEEANIVKGKLFAYLVNIKAAGATLANMFNEKIGDIEFLIDEMLMDGKRVDLRTEQMNRITLFSALASALPPMSSRSLKPTAKAPLHLSELLHFIIIRATALRM